METLELDVRIERGIDVLNRVGPVEWWSEEYINLELLDLASTESCVLGQLYGNYFDGVGRLNDELWSDSGQFDAAETGFVHRNGTDNDYQLMTERWVAAITKIRDEVAA